MLKHAKKLNNNKRFCYFTFYLFMALMVFNIVSNYINMYYDSKAHQEIRDELSNINETLNSPVEWEVE